MASSWELDRGKTGDTTTVGEVIVSRALEAVTITADMDIREAEVPPIRVGTRPSYNSGSAHNGGSSHTAVVHTNGASHNSSHTAVVHTNGSASHSSSAHTEAAHTSGGSSHSNGSHTQAAHNGGGESHGGGGEHH